MNSQELRQEREKNRLKMDEQVRSNIAAGVATTDEVWEKYTKEDEKLAARIRDIEFQEKREKESAEKAAEKRESTPKSEQEKEKIYTRAFLKALFKRNLSQEERTVLMSKQETRGTSPQSTTDAEGGFMIPTGFSDQLFTEKAAWGGMFQACTVINTPTGNDVVWPKLDDTAVVGALVAENAAAAVNDMAFTALTLQAWMYTSGIVKISEQVGLDIAFQWENILSPAFARRLGVIQNTHFTTGDDSSKANGIVTAASSGVTAAAVAAVTRSELITLEHSVNRAWRSKTNPKCGFMMNDTTLSALKTISVGTAASDNGPLWRPGVGVGSMDTIHGYPVYINDALANMAASTESILFGDFSQYIIRKSGPTTFKRLNELYAGNLQIGFLAFERYDGDLIGTNAVKSITQAAS